ncbi:M48 family metallopeptidase [Mucilaginibacter galii]|nr:M48 family metallopeptidase [Mucilaginibacter galii]
MPQNADRSVIKPSKKFKKQVWGMLGSIALFFVTYLVLFLVTVALACAFFFLAYFLVVVLHFNTLTLGLAVALIASGVLLIYFLIKFLFAKSIPADNSDTIEITAANQPELFTFIRKVTQEVGVPFPKHVYLTHEVNAGVFFDSSFWSMFLPIPKNLKIGLGLVNSLNQSEFKAVLAHEFGHFSQRSMKFGSYVYNLNKVIHNLLYDNAGYEATLGYWSNAASIFRFTAFINIHVIKGIQYILRQVYVLINKSHMSLSREMEFQADAIAAYVTGSNQSINSLRRIEVGQICYDDLLNYWNEKIAARQRAENFYTQHREVLRRFALNHRLPTDAAGLPVIDRHMAVLNNTQVSVNNQWASHPTSNEREHYLTNIGVDTPSVELAAWEIFTNAEALQKQMTSQLYTQFKESDEFEIIDTEHFISLYETDLRSNSYDPYFKEYYDSRDIAITAFEPQVKGLQTTPHDINKLFSDDNCNLPKQIKGMQQDINLLTYAISNKDIKTFDYKGKKYYNARAQDIIDQITAEKNEAEKQLVGLDQTIYTSFYNLAQEQNRQLLEEKYQALIAHQKTTTDAYVLYEKLVEEINPVYSNMQFEQINDTLAKVYLTEKELKNRLQEITADDDYKASITPEQKEILDQYMPNDLKYFDGQHYDNENLVLFNKATVAYVNITVQRFYELKNSLLNFKLKLLKQAA